MVAPNVKAETMGLMDRRAALEAEMNAVIAALSAPGGPGITGGLVDAEGFPRSDIDIPAVLAQRRKLAELRNDHMDITNKIDKNLEVLHSTKLSRNEQSIPRSSGTSASLHSGISQNDPMEEDLVTRLPFAMIDEITDGSPAAVDGLQLGDEIVKFGNVEAGDRLQERLVSEALSNEDIQVSLVIIRHGSPMNLTVTPRKWHGRGLLGFVALFSPVDANGTAHGIKHIISHMESSISSLADAISESYEGLSLCYGRIRWFHVCACADSSCSNDISTSNVN